jgi:hypothetical protein
MGLRQVVEQRITFFTLANEVPLSEICWVFDDPTTGIGLTPVIEAGVA